MIKPDAGGDDLAGFERRAIHHRDNPDAINDHFLFGIERVLALHRCADHHGVEGIDTAQFVLPAHDGFQFALSLKVEPEDRLFRDHQEEREIDCVHPFTQDGALASSLADFRLTFSRDRAAKEKGACVLEVVTGDDLAERLTRE